MAQLNAPTPSSVWMKSVMMQERIQSLVDRELLSPQALLDWKPTTGQEFPSEDTVEVVVFMPFFERGFGIPIGDFFRGLLNYYRIELGHLNPNSILDISVFIHLCEAYLGIPCTLIYGPIFINSNPWSLSEKRIGFFGEGEGGWILIALKEAA